jgi:hypothetical protein
MKPSIWVTSLLLASAALIGVPANADENDRAAMALCDCNNPANQEICSRLRQSQALERDPNHTGSIDPHSPGAYRMQMPPSFNPQGPSASRQ